MSRRRWTKSPAQTPRSPTRSVSLTLQHHDVVHTSGASHTLHLPVCIFSLYTTKVGLNCIANVKILRAIFISIPGPSALFYHTFQADGLGPERIWSYCDLNS